MNSILFFDSDCLMCNAFVQKIYDADKKEKLYFSDFNSEKAKELGLKIEENTMVLFHDGEKYYRSSAFLKTMSIIENRGLLVKIIELVPVSIRDVFYRIIAKNRRLFNPKNANKCDISLKSRIIK